MRLFRWQQLSLFILIQLLESSSYSHKIYGASTSTQTLLAYPSSLGRFPCLRQQPCIRYYERKEQRFPCLRTVISVSSRDTIPTLTPKQEANYKKPEDQKVAGLIGAFGATVVVFVILILIYICLMRAKRGIRRSSDGESSARSPSVEMGRGNTSPHAAAGSPNGMQDLRNLSIWELKHATNDFNQNNIIGHGAFGLVYKALLLNGTMVAIKRHLYSPIQNFLPEVQNIGRAHHRHIVKLIGYFQDSCQHVLVYDHVPNGNVGNHLYDSDGSPIGRLNLRQRLSIALGTAKGLDHLHSMVPPLLHMHFRTSNVLLDDTFSPKVSDYGLRKMLVEDHQAESSSAFDWFVDPELESSSNYSAASDVYSFGVFLLELITGREANSRHQLDQEENIVFQATLGKNLFDCIDKSIEEQTGDAAKELLVLAGLCLDVSRRRPSMRRIAEELERVQERAFGREDIGPVKLGSELFK